MTSWYDVEITWDGDNGYRYAIEAESAGEAIEIALNRAPQPEVSVTELGDNRNDLDYDDVIPLTAS